MFFRLMKKEGWLKDPKKHWSIRFHLDERSWIKQQFVIIDQGRVIPGNESALLKSRKRIVRDDAIKLWKRLQEEGWVRVSPQWE